MERFSWHIRSLSPTSTFSLALSQHLWFIIVIRVEIFMRKTRSRVGKWQRSKGGNVGWQKLQMNEWWDESLPKKILCKFVIFTRMSKARRFSLKIIILLYGFPDSFCGDYFVRLLFKTNNAQKTETFYNQKHFKEKLL